MKPAKPHKAPAAGEKQLRYFLIFKPYGMLSQFTEDTPGQITLAGLETLLPSDVYPVGRLDKDSEGLLLLTNDPSLNHRLLDPRFGHTRTYWAQVEGIPTHEALQRLASGVLIKTEKGPYQTLPTQTRLLEQAPPLPDRNPPVRYRAAIPTAWLELRLREGKNRQVRRMCAAVGFPVLRLVRASVQQVHLGNMLPGDVIEIGKQELFRQLGL
ncbi:MAG: pseudouridine synthase [Saprospiraceae bacterium]|nr:pseudouridine synthase [Saprospiraceae bacterium]